MIVSAPLPDAKVVAALGRGVQGHLRLVARAYPTGETYLREQSFSAPMHLSKPFLSGGALVVNLVNPTAGFLAGDLLELNVRVEEGAHLVLTNPAATRLHQMREGQAELRQDFAIASGGFLEVWPDLLIPQAGARYEQATEIRVAPGGTVLFFEILTPGRVASGEAFAFARLAWSTQIYVGAKLVVRERYELSPETESLYALQAVFPQTYQANAFILTEDGPVEAAWLEEILAWQDTDFWIGASPLVQGGWIIKILARNSLVLRRGLDKLRQKVHQSFGWREPCLRRNGFNITTRLLTSNHDILSP